MIKLSIAIPTFNRSVLLQENLSVLLPQLTPDTELLVIDNCSTDSTEEYLRNFKSCLRYIKNSSNIGADANMMACLTEARGEYIWLLCDDDIPATNAVPLILSILNSNEKPGLLSLRTHWCGIKMEGYKASPVVTGWDMHDKNKYLETLGHVLTFCSAIIVRKDIIDLNFVKSFTGTCLFPAAIAIQAAGKSNIVAIPREKILFGRSGNAGGYDAFTVFSKNLSLLLGKGKQFGFNRQSLASVYRSALKGVMLYIISVWPKTFKGSFNLFFYSFLYKEFYLYTLPAFIRSVYKNNLHNIISRFIKRKKNLAPDLSALEILQDHLDAKTNEQWYKTFFNGIQNGSVRYPYYLIGASYIEIGKNFISGPSLRLEAWSEFQGEKFTPNIKIHDDVCLNWNDHIGAVNSIEIGNRVLIGSNVLITDHIHGNTCLSDLKIPPIERRLISPGPVKIEDDVLIGENVCILPGVVIGRNSVIGAGSVVTKDIPPFSIACGVPAKWRESK